VDKITETHVKRTRKFSHPLFNTCCRCRSFFVFSVSCGPSSSRSSKNFICECRVCRWCGKMGDLTESQRGMIVGARLVGTSAATVGVSKGTVSNVMRAYSMHGQTTFCKSKQWSKDSPWSQQYMCKDNKEWTQKQWKHVMNRPSPCFQQLDVFTYGEHHRRPSCPYLTELSFDHCFALQTSFAHALSMPS
ncbi:hypothetical protein C0J52_22506, partial [Blattella germanica]